MLEILRRVLSRAPRLHLSILMAGLLVAIGAWGFIEITDEVIGVVQNPDGLFTRSAVFNSLGIPKWPRPERWPPV